LVDCPDHEPNGYGAVLEQVLEGTPGPHDTHGWPTFAGWPRWEQYTHEQIYYRWLERAWRGGLRLMTSLLVDNHALCEIYPYKTNSCNEMDGVRLQAQRARELERYIDAQSGGPGEGWFRIVTDPFEARRAVNAGKLAVVLGIEVSTPLDCGLTVERPSCDTAQIDRQLDEVYALGVRQMELANKFDNALTGVTGDGGATGVVVNGANVLETGRFWQMQTCPDDAHGHDRTQYNVHDQGAPDELTGRDSIFGVVLQLAGSTGAAPVYPQGPHCNVRGLSDLGAHAVNGLMQRGMIFDPDHMSAYARHQALDIVERAGYSGIVSSHSWADDTIYRRIWGLGGLVTPYGGRSPGFVQSWRANKDWADQRFVFGLGYGSDVNGFGGFAGPPWPGAEKPRVAYPFTGFGGVTVDRQRSGERVYDINVDGGAHYGLIPDWIEDLRALAGDAIVDDMTRGPEAYLQMWERAAGVAGDACRADVPDLTDEEIGTLRTNMSPEDVLWALGQPHARDGTDFRYCLTGGRIATVRFTEDGHLVEVTEAT
jgi:microsomal dipeptidase-like Zn-dependent dipeptidase